MITAIDKRSALVLIDLQKGIVNRKTAHPADAVIANAEKLIAAFRLEGLPVVVVNVNPIGSPASRVRAEQIAFPHDKDRLHKMYDDMKASGYFDIVPGLHVQEGDIFITKQTWNAFYETRLHEELVKREITGIVLAGISTSVGVEGTARSANERGFNISFAIDAMTDTSEAAHEHSIDHIFPRIGETGSTEDIIEKLKRR